MGRKLKFVLSDLHLGAGYAHERGNNLEDFTADQAFVNFLHEVWQESEKDQREVELIINGDLFEFLQVPAVDSYTPQTRYPEETYSDSSEAASVHRLNVIIDGHPEFFDALSDFIHIESPQRRITIIKGNHDVNLYWPGVKSRLREVLGATGSRASLLLFAEEFVSREKIYVEHGHQRTEKMNSFPDFLDPRRPDQPDQLHYPAGSRFVVNFLNHVEQERWFVDSVKPLTTLIWYGLRWDFQFAVNTLLSFVHYAPGMLVGSLAATDSPVAPVDPFIQELENDQLRQEMAARYQDDPAFRQEFHQQVQQQLNNALLSKDVVAAANVVPAQPDPVEMGQATQQHQQSVLRQAAEEVARREGAQVVLFGHTHAPVEEALNTGSVYINTGCWLWEEDFSTARPETWKALFEGQYVYGQATGRLPYARIDYDEQDRPTAVLLDFAHKNARVSTGDQPEGCLTGILRRMGRSFRRSQDS